ncbi:ester cyclase [Halopenitus persicus]|uniref:ester cyclase n=1 Tax=Halopenitus persicus TaxID=1048396 RepID=UPI0012FD8749|nr:ester cyclase [Halopenitus persicus]
MSAKTVDTEVLDRVWKEAFGDGDMTVVEEEIPRDYAVQTPGADEPIEGRDAFKTYVAEYSKAFPDISITVEDRIVGDDAIVEHFRIKGTHKGEFREIPPTDDRLEFTGIVIHYVENGEIIESVSKFDTMSVMEQLGVIESPN